MSGHQFPGRLLNPRVFSAYYTPFPKSRRFLTLINAFLRLRRKDVWDRRNMNCDPRTIVANLTKCAWFTILIATGNCAVPYVHDNVVISVRSQFFIRILDSTASYELSSAENVGWGRCIHFDTPPQRAVF